MGSVLAVFKDISAADVEFLPHHFQDGLYSGLDIMGLVENTEAMLCQAVEQAVWLIGIDLPSDV